MRICVLLAHAAYLSAKTVYVKMQATYKGNTLLEEQSIELRTYFMIRNMSTIYFNLSK